MHIALTSSTVSIKWGDVATWVLAVGTSGTLLTGLYIILRDRMTEYRSQINKFRVAIQAPDKDSPVYLTLRIINASDTTLYDVDTYFLGRAWFPNEDRAKTVGLHFSGYALRGLSIWEHQVFEGSDGITRDSHTILTTRVTDINGRTWIIEYGKRKKKLVTWRTTLRINRRVRNLQEGIDHQAEIYEEFSSRDMTRIDLPK